MVKEFLKCLSLLGRMIQFEQNTVYVSPTRLLNWIRQIRLICFTFLDFAVKAIQRMAARCETPQTKPHEELPKFLQVKFC